MKKTIILIIILLLPLMVFAKSEPLIAYQAECSDDGSLTLEIASNDPDNIIYTEGISIRANHLFYSIVDFSFPVEGIWNNKEIILKADKTKSIANFKTGEAVFTKPGDYRLDLNYSIGDTTKIVSTTVTCPGLTFSCTLIGLEIINCTTKDKEEFKAFFEIKGVNQSRFKTIDLLNDIDYKMRATEKFLDIRNSFSVYGSLPINIDIINLEGDLYLFTKNFTKNSVESISAQLKNFEECENKEKYPDLLLTSYKQCIDITSETPEIEEKPQEEKIEIEEEKPNEITGNIILGINKEQEKVEEKPKTRKSWTIGLILGIIILIVIIYNITEKVIKGKKKEYL